MGWLIGPFVSAHPRVYHDPELARSFLCPLVKELGAHCVGSLSEILDGNPHFTLRDHMAQAQSAAQVLWVWKETALARRRVPSKRNSWHAVERPQPFRTPVEV